MVKRRQARIDEELKRILSDLIAREVRDSRLSPMTSVTRTEVTNDLKYAKVFVSVYGNEEEKENTMAALRSAAGFLRSQLASRVDMRRAPELTFELDDSIDNGLHIASLLEQVSHERS